MTLVNKERTSRGLNALVLGGANLNAATELRARELAEVNSHTRPDGTSCFTVLNTFNVKDQAVGEVAAWGSRSPEEVVNSWMNSDGHRAILLDPEARKMCVSCYYDTNSDYGTNWAMLVTECSTIKYISHYRGPTDAQEHLSGFFCILFYVILILNKKQEEPPWRIIAPDGARPLASTKKKRAALLRSSPLRTARRPLWHFWKKCGRKTAPPATTSMPTA